MTTPMSICRKGNINVTRNGLSNAFNEDCNLSSKKTELKRHVTMAPVTGFAVKEKYEYLNGLGSYHQYALFFWRGKGDEQS